MFSYLFWRFGYLIVNGCGICIHRHTHTYWDEFFFLPQSIHAVSYINRYFNVELSLNSFGKIKNLASYQGTCNCPKGYKTILHTRDFKNTSPEKKKTKQRRHCIIHNYALAMPGFFRISQHVPDLFLLWIPTSCTIGTIHMNAELHTCFIIVPSFFVCVIVPSFL